MPSIRCGNCRETHTSVADVRDCYAWSAEDEAQYQAEIAAEAAAERFYEEGPAHLRGWEEAEAEERAWGGMEGGW